GNSIKAESLSQLLSIFTISKKSNGIALYIEETNIKRGKDILNKIVELYNIRGENEKNEMGNNTAKFITERLDIIYADLSKSEQAIEGYKKDRDFINLQAEATYLMTVKGELELLLSETETQYAILEMIDQFLNNPENNTSLVPFNADIPTSSEGIEVYNTLILERMNLASDAKPNNIRLISLDTQIDALRSNILISIGKSKDSMGIRLRELRKKMDDSNSKLGVIPTQEREYIELNRQREIQSALYSLLLKKREENELVLAATTPKGLIVDKAYAFNEPIAPKKEFVGLMAIFFGIMIPIVILYVKGLLNNKITTIEDLEYASSIPVLGEVCINHGTDALVVKAGKTSSIVELFRLIRNNIQFMLSSNRNKVILVTSSVSGEGKTFVSANLASSFALLDKKVVLVGMDIRSPKIAEYLSLKPQPGVTTFLSQDSVNVNQLIQHSEVKGLDIVVAGPIPPNPSELLLSNRVEELFTSLREMYDYVIIDSAPIAMVSDTFSLSRFADTLVYVTRAGRTTKSNIKYLNNVVGRGQLSNVSLVLNGSDPKLSSGYGYGYGAKTE
ncbi:MAG: polysaccharide biosynthesis tyrosine autokinase, partial [Bacteroidales bacterium]